MVISWPQSTDRHLITCNEYFYIEEDLENKPLACLVNRTAKLLLRQMRSSLDAIDLKTRFYTYIIHDEKFLGFTTKDPQSLYQKIKLIDEGALTKKIFFREIFGEYDESLIKISSFDIKKIKIIMGSGAAFVYGRFDSDCIYTHTPHSSKVITSTKLRHLKEKYGIPKVKYEYEL